MATIPPINDRELRSALGCFATGVTVVTTNDAQQRPIGVTANSYNSVSLDPPMVLWSLARSSSSMPAFMASDAFAIHILSDEQEALAQRFAKRGADKFDGLDFDRDALGLPLLPHYAARLQCRTAHRYDGGDHVIFVGTVTDFDRSERKPLVFHLGRFARVHHPAG